MNGPNFESTTMEPEDITEEAREKLRQAGRYVRENPVPTVMGALALGLAIGLAVRLMERDKRSSRIGERLDETEEYIRSVLEPLAKKSKRTYTKTADSIREAVENAVERAKDIDVEEYTDPVVGWWQRFWKKCCG